MLLKNPPPDGARSRRLARIHLFGAGTVLLLAGVLAGFSVAAGCPLKRPQTSRGAHA